MSENSWNNFSKMLSAYGMGIVNAPVDITRYAGLGANSLFEWTGLRTPVEAKHAAQAIRETTDKLPFLPEEVTNYRNWLKKEAPENFSLGEVVGGVITGNAIGSRLPYFLQKGTPMVRAINSHPGTMAGILSAMREWGIEPTMENTFTPQKQDKNDE